MTKIRRLSLHRHLEKKKPEATKGVEDHIKLIAVALNTLYAGRANQRFLERGEPLSPLRHNVDLGDRGEEYMEVYWAKCDGAVLLQAEP